MATAKVNVCQWKSHSRPVKPGILMCDHHWFRIPQALRTGLAEARLTHGPKSTQAKEATQAIIDYATNFVEQ